MSLITQEIAQAVVHEIGLEMDYHINLMDEHGVIIASTDQKRIGMKHEGALRILREGIEELPIEEDDATETTRIGTNLAIHYQKKYCWSYRYHRTERRSATIWENCAPYDRGAFRGKSKTKHRDFKSSYCLSFCG